MSDTPRTDARWKRECEAEVADPRHAAEYGMLEECGDMERELAAARAEVEELRQCISKLTRYIESTGAGLKFHAALAREKEETDD